MLLLCSKNKIQGRIFFRRLTGSSLKYCQIIICFSCCTVDFIFTALEALILRFSDCRNFFFFLKNYSVLSLSLHSQGVVGGRKICLPPNAWRVWVWEVLEGKGTPQIRMHWGSPRKVRSTECVISGGYYSSHYLPFDRAAHWPGMLANGEENSARRCKSLIQVPHEYLVSRIQASDLENKVPPQSKWQAELVSC